ncbi:MAG: hypothetical protein CSB48_08760 [Proteobacteria bacterium]|nr:MAG: hypothetical protein CSB48_08760 [Pseudomonadota bacterium]
MCKNQVNAPGLHGVSALDMVNRANAFLFLFLLLSNADAIWKPKNRLDTNLTFTSLLLLFSVALTVFLLFYFVFILVFREM